MIKNEIEHSAIIWARVDSVINLILLNPRYLQAKRNSELTELVIDLFKKEKVTIGERTAQRYVKEAKAEIRRIAKEDNKKKLDRAVKSRLSLIERCRTAKNLKTELLALKDLAELEALYPDKNINLKGELLLKNVDLSKLSERQLERIKNGEDPQQIILSGE